MLTIACVLFDGDERTLPPSHVFGPEDVDRLYRGVSRNLSEFRFVCVTDRPSSAFSEPVETYRFRLPEWVGSYMASLEIFRPDLDIERGLYVGLDTVITGDLSEIMTYDGRFAMVNNVTGSTDLCTGAMMWSSYGGGLLWDAWEREQDVSECQKTSRRFGVTYPSDLRWLENAIGASAERLDERFPGQIIPWPMWDRHKDSARIVYFYGLNKPHNCSVPELVVHWR